MLSYVFPSHFHHADVLQVLMNLLGKLGSNYPNETPLVLSVFTFLGKYKPLYEEFPEIMNELATICKQFAESGTPKQAKGAIRCIYVNMPDLHDSLFPHILDLVKMNLTPESEHYRTAIVALGHIAYNVPDKCKVQIKNIVSRKVSL